MWSNEKIRSLTSIPGLEPLADIAKDLKVRIGAIGSLCRRLLWAQETDFAAQDVFDLAPFTSDIDIVHTGDDDDSKELLQQIIERVPFAEMLRWQVLSKDRYKSLQSARLVASVVPQDNLELWNDGLVDRDGARAELRKKRFSLKRRPNIRASDLFNEGHYLECFSALIYLRNLVQAQPFVQMTDAALARSSGVADAGRIFKESVDLGDGKKLADVRYLTTRMIYLLASFATSCGTSGLMDRLLTATSLDAMLDAWRKSNDRLTNAWRSIRGAVRADRPLVISANLKTGVFRFTDWTTKSTAASAADTHLAVALKSSKKNHKLGDAAVVAIDGLEINEGEPWYSQPAPDQYHEPLCVNIPINKTIAAALKGIPAENLTAAISVEARTPSTGKAKPTGFVFAVPTVCTYRGGLARIGSALQLRANCYGALIAAQKMVTKIHPRARAQIRLFVLTPRSEL